MSDKCIKTFFPITKYKPIPIWYHYTTTIYPSSEYVYYNSNTYIHILSCNTLIDYKKKYSDKKVCGTVNLEAEQSQICL